MSKGCEICLVPEDEHTGMSHKFSVDGELAPVAPQKSEKPRNLVAIPDPALRALLLDKGLISYEELAAKEVEILGRQRVPERP